MINYAGEDFGKRRNVQVEEIPAIFVVFTQEALL